MKSNVAGRSANTMIRGRFFKAVYGLALVSLFTVGSAGAQTGTEQKPQPRVAVVNIDVTHSVGYDNWSTQGPLLSDSMGDMLTTEMVKAGSNLIERTRIKDVLAEQSWALTGVIDPETASEIGKVLGVDYLILGSVTEFGIKEQSVGGSTGWITGGKLKLTTARVKIDMRIVNTLTGKIEGAYSSEGSEKIVDVSIVKDWWKNVNFQNDEWSGSQLGKAARKAVTSVAKDLSAKCATLPSLNVQPSLVAKVASVLSSDECIIDAGKKLGVCPGDTFQMTRVCDVTKNEKGDVVYERTETIGTATVVDVQEKGARLKLTVTPNIKVKQGDVATRSPKA